MMSYLFRTNITLGFLVLCLAAFSPASATELFVDNQLENNVAVSVVYYDNARGGWVTRGWYNVGGSSEKSFVIHNADPEKGAYYYARTAQGEACVDLNQIGETLQRWVDRGAPYVFGGKPKHKPEGKAVYMAPFYRLQFSEGYGGWVLRLDGIPSG